MEKLSRTKIIEKFEWALRHDEEMDLECIHAPSGKIVSVKFSIKDPEFFTDDLGVRWVRE